jgi:hypothetical protein
MSPTAHRISESYLNSKLTKDGLRRTYTLLERADQHWGCPVIPFLWIGLKQRPERSGTMPADLDPQEKVQTGAPMTGAQSWRAITLGKLLKVVRDRVWLQHYSMLDFA